MGLPLEIVERWVEQKIINPVKIVRVVTTKWVFQTQNILISFLAETNYYIVFVFIKEGY